MRRVIVILLATSAGVASANIGMATVAAAADQIAMPFDCGLEAGRVKVQPSPEKRYEIVGERENETVTTCQNAGACRKVTLHKFLISCGGAGVPWMRVAAAISSSTNAPAWIERGQLNLVLPADSATPSLPACNRRPAFAAEDGPLQRVAYAGACTKMPRRAAFERVALPAGFAPVAELGATLVLAGDKTAAEPSGAPQQAGSQDDSSPGTFGEMIVAKADANSAVGPIEDHEFNESPIDPAVATNAWVTIVRTEPPLAVSASQGSVVQIPWSWLLLALALSTSVGLIAMRFTPAEAVAAVSTPRPRSWSLARIAPAGTVTIRRFTNAGKAVSGLLEQTGSVVAELKDAGPLREVLQSELDQVRQRLAALETTLAKEGGIAGNRNAPQFRALIRELERIRRIANSAAASLTRGSRGAKLPATVSEAYDVLGINPDVREEVMKKIVDALRMSWHPDHAKGDSDRAERESRIRQINVAWEMITAQRAAA